MGLARVPAAEAGWCRCDVPAATVVCIDGPNGSQARAAHVRREKTPSTTVTRTDGSGSNNNNRSWQEDTMSVRRRRRPVIDTWESRLSSPATATGAAAVGGQWMTQCESQKQAVARTGHSVEAGVNSQGRAEVARHTECRGRSRRGCVCVFVRPRSRREEDAAAVGAACDLLHEGLCSFSCSRGAKTAPLFCFFFPPWERSKTKTSQAMNNMQHIDGGRRGKAAELGWDGERGAGRARKLGYLFVSSRWYLGGNAVVTQW